MSNSSPRNDAKAGSQKDAKSPSAQCKLKSGMGGLAIVPVRYALDDVDDKNQQLNPWPQKELQWKPPFKVKESFYTLRQLRDGWLYVYSEKDETFHEYQVDGIKLIKWDWGDDEADKPPEQRGTARSKDDSHTYIRHSVKDTIFLAYSHQRWTWRICEYFRSNATARKQWMRKLDLPHYYHCMEHPHTADISLLGARVADISATDPEKNVAIDAFKWTCTPLDKQYLPDDDKDAPAPSTSSNDDDILKTLLGEPTEPNHSDWHSPLKASKDESAPKENNFNQVAVKASHSENEYKADLDKQGALFVALDDLLADTSDNFLLLAHELASRDSIIHTEEKLPKFQMATIARSLGRVLLPDAELPEKAKISLGSRINFENDLTNFLIETRVVNDSVKGFSASDNPNSQNKNSFAKIHGTPQYTQYLTQQKSKFLKKWGYKVPNDFYERFNTVQQFEDEVRWKDLDNFLLEYGEKLKPINQKIELRHHEFLDVMTQLGIQTERFGLDTQYFDGQRYLYTLFRQMLIGVVHASPSEDSVTLLKKKLSLHSPDNLLALGSFGFSKDLLDAIDKSTVGDSVLNSIFTGTGIFIARLNEFRALNNVTSITKQLWYKELLQPLQDTIDALSQASKSVINRENFKGVMESVVDILMPYQWEKADTPKALIKNLRILIAMSVIDDTPLTIAGISETEQRLSEFQTSLKNVVSYAFKGTKKNNTVDKQAAEEYHAKINSRTIESAMLDVQPIVTTDVQLAKDANERLKKQLSQKIDKVANKTNKIWKGMGKSDGLLAIIAVWNLSFTIISSSDDLDSKNKETIKEAKKRIASAFAWGTSAIFSVLKTRNTERLMSMDAKVLKKGIRDVLKLDLRGSNEEVLLKKTISSVRAMAIFGLIGVVLDVPNLNKSIHDELESGIARAGYYMQLTAVRFQGFVFAAQLFSSIFKIGSLYSILEGILFKVLLSVGGFLLVIGLIAVCFFSKSDLEKWLEQTLWGKHPNEKWTFEQSIKELLKIIYKPNITLEHIYSDMPEQIRMYDPASGNYYYQAVIPPKWHLKVILNSPFIDQTSVGLKVMYKSENTSPKLIDVSQGIWSSTKPESYEYTLNFKGAPSDGSVHEIGVCLGLILNLQGSKEYMYYYGELSDRFPTKKEIQMNYSEEVEKNSNKLNKMNPKKLSKQPQSLVLNQKKRSEVYADIPLSAVFSRI